MAKFAYNNAQNANNGHTLFELNCEYHSLVFFKEDIDHYSESKLANELLAKLWKLMTVWRKNLHYAQEL